MGASNTPLYDLIELSGINAFATYTTTPGGGGDILGFVDNATYTDGDPTNSPTQIGELNETFSGNGGTITIDGVEYNLDLYTPSNTSNPVTITYDGGSTKNLTGDDYSTQVAFMTLTPTGGGAARYFMAIDDAVGNLPQITQIQTRGIDFTPSGDDVLINLDQNEVVTACFASGTEIDTPDGPCPVEDLCPGDRVLTLDDGPQLLLWSGFHRLGPPDLSNAPGRRPIVIPKGAFGATKALLVSPQHCVLINPTAPRAQQVFARAGHLAEFPGPTRIAKGRREVCYHHLLLPRHCVIRAQGVWSESFYPGDMALNGFSTVQRLAVIGHFPTLPDLTTERAYGPTARPILRRKQVLSGEAFPPNTPETPPRKQLG